VVGSSSWGGVVVLKRGGRCKLGGCVWDIHIVVFVSQPVGSSVILFFCFTSISETVQLCNFAGWAVTRPKIINFLFFHLTYVYFTEL